MLRGVIFASKYSRNSIVMIPMFAYLLGLFIVRWTGHLFVDWLLLVGLLAVACAMFGLDALLPRSAGDSWREKWWRSPVLVSPLFVAMIATYFIKDSDMLRGGGGWLLLLPLVLAVCAIFALEFAVPVAGALEITISDALLLLATSLRLSTYRRI